MTTDQPELREAFKKAAEMARREYGVTLHLIRITGKRFSYVAGDTSSVPGDAAAKMLRLSATIAVAVYGWDDLSDAQREALAAKMRRLVPGARP